MLDRSAYFRRWAALHGGHEPSEHPLTRVWLSAAYAVAGPLQRWRPLAVTALGLAVALAVPGAIGLGWPLPAAALVLASGLLDSVDGAVAIGTGRDSPAGYVWDSVADRLADTAYVTALWLAGAPGWLCLLAGGLGGLQEYIRARAGAAGMREIGVVTVAERPTRVIVAALGLALGAATIGAGVAVVLGVVGLAQVSRVVAGRLERTNP